MHRDVEGEGRWKPKPINYIGAVNARQNDKASQRRAEMGHREDIRGSDWGLVDIRSGSQVSASDL